MNIAVLGTGMVGRAHAKRLIDLGHAVLMGTNDVSKTEARSQPDEMGNAPFADWHVENAAVRLVRFPEAVSASELIINALFGDASVPVLGKLATEIGGKIVIDISNPLDFSHGVPPTLSVSNTDSLGEQIQRALPDAKIVKSLNTLTALLQVNPRQLADGMHHVFVSGNDVAAKQTVIGLLNQYGLPEIIYRGDISTAIGPEKYLPLWLAL